MLTLPSLRAGHIMARLFLSLLLLSLTPHVVSSTEAPAATAPAATEPAGPATITAPATTPGAGSDHCAGINPFTLYTYVRVLECVTSIPFDKESELLRQYNLNQTYQLIDGIYSFADVSQDSTNNDADLAKDLVDRGWEVHKLNVKWRNDLKRINSTEYPSMFDYHHDLWKVFNRFYDAHTFYTQIQGFPFFYVLPFRFSTELHMNPIRKIYEMTILLQPNMDTETYNAASGIPEKIDAAKHFNKTVLKINGVQAVKYVQTWGDSLGNYKDKSVRFNNALVASSGWTVAGQSILAFGRRKSDGMEIEFADGTKLRTTNMFLTNREFKSAEELATNMFSPTKFNALAFDFISGLEDIDNEESLKNITKGPTIDTNGTNTLLKEHPQARTADPQTAVPTVGDFIKNFKAPNHDRLTSHLKNIYMSDGNLVGVFFNYSNVPIIKFMSFAPNGGDIMGFAKEATKLFSDAIKMGAESGSKRLVLDLSGNGEGILTLAYTLLSMVVKDFDTYDKLCGPVDFPISDQAREWLTTFNSSEMGTAKFVNQSQVKEFGDVLGVLTAFMEYTNNAEGSKMLQPFLDKIKVDALTTADVATANQMIADARMAVLASFSDNTGWAPFSVKGGLNPTTLKPLNDSVLSNTVTYTRGGVTRNYTARYIPDYCADVDLTAEGERGKVPKFFDELIVFTDGRCGSACSAFTTQILAGRKGRVVTAGGKLGNTMDTSSFRGGNVQSADAWTKDYWTHLVVGLLMTYEKDKFPEAIPYPTLDSTMININFANGYTGYAGPKSLPIEFYKKPADKHWWSWPTIGVGNGNGEWFEKGEDEITLWDTIYRKLSGDNI